MNLALHVASPRIEAFYQYYTDRHAQRKREARPDDCDSWVDWYGQVVCNAETLVHLATLETIDGLPETRVTRYLHSLLSLSYCSTHVSVYARPQLLEFDHIHPNPSRMLEPPPRTAILYGSLSSSNFWELHNYLYTASNGPSPHLEYVFRPIPESHRDESQRFTLTGYGVALDLKKMDYLALDDRRQGMLMVYP